MHRKISADYVYPVASKPIKNGVVILDEKGKILEISSREKFDKADLEVLDGIIVPGFINTHCHLELSHMRGKCPTGIGLIPFISHVIKERWASGEIIQKAIEAAEKEMIDSGIVAIGDIANTPDSFLQKQKANLYYYTFVEYFDLFQETNTEKEFEKYNVVFDQLAETPKNKKSKVPHAPYSVSTKLFKLLSEGWTESSETISIHNQETIPENELFLHNKGEFITFYERMGLDIKAIPRIGNTAIHYELEYLQKGNKNVFIHNTFTTKEEIKVVHQKLGRENVFWTTCPNANLYIENRLPYYQNFIDMGAQVSIGTDSLASNWQLSILEEMKTILQYQSYLNLNTVLEWATLNGARALGFDKELGSLEIGKTPGLVLIENMDNGILSNNATAKRIK